MTYIPCPCINLTISVSNSSIGFLFQIICHVFAVLIHYFFLATYAWLMNETFNLYTSVTYSAHAAHGDMSDAGSFLRYNVLGWGKYK